jgi:tetratricopeptide (TPR) repeat protein
MRATVRSWMGRIGTWLRLYAGASGAYGAGLQYLERGDAAAAAEAFADAQRLWLREVGPWHGGVVLAMAKRAACYVRLGRVREGVRLYERALALDRGLRGDATERVRTLSAELAQARAFLSAGPALGDHASRP